jgi:hypothetical protein
LAECEDGRRPAADVTEIYPIFDEFPDQEGRLRFRVAENADEITFLRELRALSVACPDTSHIIFTDRGRLFARSIRFVLPTIAYTAADTVTDLLTAADGNYFSATGPGELVVEFQFDTVLGGLAKPLTDSPGGGTPLPPPDKGIQKPLVSTGKPEPGVYRFFARDRSEKWVSVATMPPRLNPLDGYVEMADYIVDGRLTMKIEYEGRIEVDWLPYWFFDSVDVATQPLELVSATHSADGDVREALTDKRPTTVTVEKGEYVDLVFQSEPPQAGYRQVVLLASEGCTDRYHSRLTRPASSVLIRTIPTRLTPRRCFVLPCPKRAG